MTGVSDRPPSRRFALLGAPPFWLSLFVFLALVIGRLILTDYGEAWDEHNFFQYGGEALSAYEALFSGRAALPYSDPTLRHYGAWFWMLCVLLGRLFPNAYISDVAHGLTFLTFQAGVVGMYALARRWLKPWPAFGAALLLATQPLLWGHAFINERDIPCLSGFILTVYFGLRWKDSLAGALPAPQPPPAPPERGADWRALPLSLRLLLPALWALGGLALAWGTGRAVQGWLERAPALADPTFVHDLDLYLRPWLARFWGAALFLIGSLLWLALTALPFLPRWRAALWTGDLRPRLQLTGRLLRSPLFWAAAAALGLTAGIRILGWMAGALVAWFAWQQHRQRALWPLALYALTAFAILYLTWPYLWGEPFLRLLITLRLMLTFPWPGQVLFNGQYYAGNEVPPSYLPRLMALQTSEPVLLLALAGLILLLWGAARRTPQAGLGQIVLLWLGLPLAGAMLGSAYLYDNFRQFLFLLPPLFLLAGRGLEALWERLPHPAWALVCGLSLLPGLIGLFSLHPYQYIYYNSLTGGVSGAFRRYEMDYWGTSFRAAADYLNRCAPPGARVVVWGPPTTFWRYARPDLRVYHALETGRPQADFYALISTRYDADLTIYPDLPILFQVQKGGAVLAVVRYVPP
ncbi:MAG: hypothetical protein ABWK53_05245 [Anaerolineales bacterium]